MADNRISLRLDDNEIRTIDEFLDTHKDFASRSHLARESIRRFISEENGENEQDGSQENQERGRMVKVILAPAEMDLLEQMVKGGYFLSVTDAISYIMKTYTINRENRLEKAMESICDSREKLVQVDREQ
jgi:Arc/MetJ-type ribon-helix-helix transcriptional regulator